MSYFAGSLSYALRHPVNLLSSHHAVNTYTQALRWVLRNQPITLLVTILVAALSIFLYFKVPKGFFPQQDGADHGSRDGSQDISFQSMSDKMQRYVDIVMKGSGQIDSGGGFAGGNTALNQGRFFMMLKPLEERGRCKKEHFWQTCKNVTADDVINRLRGKLAVVPGATLILQ